MLCITSVSVCFHITPELYNLQVSLTLWKVFYFSCIRATDGKNHLFIHLNLCIALALALVVFVVGIENASSNEACAPMYITIHDISVFSTLARLQQHSYSICLYLPFVGCCVKECFFT